MKGVLKIKKRYNFFVILLSALLLFITNQNTVSANENLDYFDIEHIFETSNRYHNSFDKSYHIKAVEILGDVDKGTIINIVNENGKGTMVYLYPNKITEVDYENSKYIYSSIGESTAGAYQLKGTHTLRFYYESEPLIPINDINNLSYDFDNNSIMFNYDLPIDDNFSHLQIYQNNELLLDNVITNNIRITDLEYDTKYNFTIYAIGKDGYKTTGVTREIALPSDPNLIPSNNIFGLTHSVSDTNVSFNYSLPLDNNFSHLKIYRNNELINDNYQLAEFIDTGLDPETEYNYRFVSVNKMDISNAGYAITVKTMIENDTIPPAVPTGLNAKAMNSGIILNWNSNNETDLKGYNIYLNGTKLNKNPISNTIYNVTNLENGTEYNFTVSAVDTFDNESEQSIVVSSVPDVDKLPIFKLDTSLSSVGSSIENWFSEIWVIVAFATSIPLAFLIAQRVKYLFIA